MPKKRCSRKTNAVTINTIQAAKRTISFSARFCFLLNKRFMIIAAIEINKIMRKIRPIMLDACLKNAGLKMPV
ncbi:hypothetical protein HMPREF9370_1602 [Neisseria wadsworthii 9715]|uniref:Uncharacterized protein n=1 Tax=Neisseria wadsworthii 9715 TaxID=1030841 RepID=G4CR92_9NEIS|nr:hypothetical protein HMPREF9370_1602 [Neisseria wadsworthii 9715]